MYGFTQDIEKINMLCVCPHLSPPQEHSICKTNVVKIDEL